MHFHKTLNVINSHPIEYLWPITHLTTSQPSCTFTSILFRIRLKVRWHFLVTVKRNKGNFTLVRCRGWQQQIARQNKLVITRGDVHYSRDLRTAPVANISRRWQSNVIGPDVLGNICLGPFLFEDNDVERS